VKYVISFTLQMMSGGSFETSEPRARLLSVTY